MDFRTAKQFCVIPLQNLAFTVFLRQSQKILPRPFRIGSFTGRIWMDFDWPVVCFVLPLLRPYEEQFGLVFIRVQRYLYTLLRFRQHIANMFQPGQSAPACNLPLRWITSKSHWERNTAQRPTREGFCILLRYTSTLWSEKRVKFLPKYGLDFSSALLTAQSSFLVTVNIQHWVSFRLRLVNANGLQLSGRFCNIFTLLQCPTHPEARYRSRFQIWHP